MIEIGKCYSVVHSPPTGCSRASIAEGVIVLVLRQVLSPPLVACVKYQCLLEDGKTYLLYQTELQDIS